MKFYYFYLLLLVLWEWTKVSVSQTFNSFQNVVILYEEEGRLTRALKKYIDVSIKNGSDIDDTIIRFYESTHTDRSAVLDCEKWIGHPVNTFRLLSRVAEDWDNVFSDIFCEDCEDTFARMDLNISRKIAINSIQTWPTHQDVVGAMKAILRLWRTYKLDIGQLFNGTILQRGTDPLSSEEIITIGKVAIHEGMLYEGITWLTSLLEVRGQGRLGNEGTHGSVRRILASAYQKADMPWKAVEVLDQGEINERGSNYEFYKKRVDEVTQKKKRDVLMPSDYTAYTSTYEALCRGSIKSAKQLSKLHCFLKKTGIPFYMAKAEIANRKPMMVLFHDVIYESEAKFLREQGTKHLVVAKVLEPDGSTLLSRHRMSKIAWLNDTDHPSLLRLNKRISAITGLDMTFSYNISSVEPYQVQNYGVGGMYETHIDALGIPLWDMKTQWDGSPYSGDRIATWMFYLNYVEAGGATVFPKLKIRIPATQGGAVFWYNMLPSGLVDERTWHAGCPVLLGSKWVANKWIRQHGQILISLCGKKEDSEFNILNDN